MPDTASQPDDQLDDIPDFVDRCLGLPEGERGPPDTEMTLNWLVAEVCRLMNELAGRGALPHVQERLFEQLEQVARTAIAQSKASRAELDALAVKAGNYDVIIRLINTKQMRLVRAKRGARPDLDRRTDWPLLRRFIHRYPSVAEAADVLAKMQWRLENPKRTREDRAEVKRIKGRWMTRISRDRSSRNPTLASAEQRDVKLTADLESEIERIVRKAARAS